MTVFNPQGGKMIGRILSRSGDMSSSSTSVSVQLMALQHQVPPQVLRAEEKRLGVRLLGAEREIFFTRSVQVSAPTSILGEKLPVTVAPADIDNPQDAGSYLDGVPPTGMLARFLLNSTEPVTLSLLSSHDILLPVAVHPDAERKHDAGKMAVQVDIGGRDMSLISCAPTRDKTLAQRTKAPPICKGLRVRCMGSAPSFTFDPHSFWKHQEKIGSSAFAALVSLRAKILTQFCLAVLCCVRLPVPRRTTFFASCTCSQKHASSDWRWQVEEPLCTPSTTETEGQHQSPRKKVGESPSPLRSATPILITAKVDTTTPTASPAKIKDAYCDRSPTVPYQPTTSTLGQSPVPARSSTLGADNRSPTQAYFSDPLGMSSPATSTEGVKASEASVVPSKIRSSFCICACGAWLEMLCRGIST